MIGKTVIRDKGAPAKIGQRGVVLEVSGDLCKVHWENNRTIWTAMAVLKFPDDVEEIRLQVEQIIRDHIDQDLDLENAIRMSSQCIVRLFKNRL